ncbi:hypothetical protein C8R44DRAFT_871037 [Mycena epipterygia]|nr:hypothetical protein C8R44DRAFT_871037 [Mycena epipterygia]
MLPSDIVGVRASIAAVLLVIICCLANAQLRGAVARWRRKFIHQPVFDADLATHHAIPFPQRLPRFPPPAPAELASLDTRAFESLRPPRSPVLNRRQFPAPGSPNQQLLSPRQRQNAQHRLQYPPSLPTTPVLPFPATPPQSPARDLAYRSHLHIYSPVHVKHAALLPSTLSPFAVEFIPSISRLASGPPRSSLTRMIPLPGSPDVLASPATIKPSMRMEPVLPVRLPSPVPVPISPQVQTITFDEPSAPLPIAACPESPASTTSTTTPASIQTDPPFLPRSPPKRLRVMRRAPSFPSSLYGAPLSIVLEEIPQPSSSARKTNATKMRKRHSMVIRTSVAPIYSPAVPDLASSPVPLSEEALSNGQSEPGLGLNVVADGQTADASVNSPTLEEDRVIPAFVLESTSSSIPLSEEESPKGLLSSSGQSERVTEGQTADASVISPTLEDGRDIPAFVPVSTSSPIPRSPKKGLSNSTGRSNDAADSQTADDNVTSTILEEDRSCRHPLSDMHNTATQGTPEVSKRLAASHLCPPSGIHSVAALISPSKAPRHVDRGPNPVYHYDPKAPAVAIAKSIVHTAQDDFKGFSTALAARFEQKGWAEAGPNELAPAKKNKKKKKKVAAMRTPAAPPMIPVYVAASSFAINPPSPSVGKPTPRPLLPAFEETNSAEPLSAPLQDKKRPPVVIDLTFPLEIDLGSVESASGERVVNNGCHPDCGDIYCPGGCSAIEC